MHWIYILKCQNNTIYIGETTRLFRRLNEHQNGTGGETTKSFKPKYLMGIYKLENDGLCLKNIIEKDMFEKGYLKENKYWGLNLEEEITLMYMKAMNNNWEDVYGGKYHIGYRPEENPSKDMVLFRPYCNCKIPADINEYNGKKYWRCCKKNYFNSLINFIEEGDLRYSNTEPCDFYKKYIHKEEFKCENPIYRDPKDIKNFKDLIKKSPWMKNILNTKDCDEKICVFCDCDINKNNGMFYGTKLLCIECFKNKNTELAKLFNRGFIPSI